jgi:GDPmannose 4,6-dehydratase
MRNLILGGPGQDAYYMGEYLNDLNEDFLITVRRFDLPYYYNKFLNKTLRIDLTETHSVDNLIKDYNPDFIYNFAGISNIPDSFENPVNTISTNTQININILNAVNKFCKNTKIYFASSIESLRKDSPYGLSKSLCMGINDYYREKHNLFIGAGINCQHNSKYRSEGFFWGKVCNYVGRLKRAIESNSIMGKLNLGNIKASRDILSAEDIVKSAYAILNSGAPRDYLVTSGHLYSNELILELAFSYIGVDWKDYCNIDESLFRPKDDLGTMYYSDQLTKDTGWKPEVDIEKLLIESIEYNYGRI